MTLEQQMAYATWRLAVWQENAGGYSDIDQAVAAGKIHPGMEPREAACIMRPSLKSTDCEQE